MHPIIEPIAAPLGAFVHCADLRALDEEAFAPIREAWLAHLVLVFRGQTLTDDDLFALGRRFGELDDTQRPQPGKQKGTHQGALTVVSNVVENGVAIGALGNVDLVWHTDVSYVEVPPDASVLHALEVPATGGETGFSNMYLALETLDAPTRRRIESLSIKHDATHNSGGFLRGGHERPTDVRTSPGPWHPIVRTHPETGADALYLGRRPYAYVEGLEIDASEALLDALWAHADDPALAWYHRWQPGDVVIWDNRCTMHRRNSFDAAARRVMHRTQVKGTRPRRVAGATPNPMHTRGHAVGIAADSAR
jgi:taurine dioxygenase